MSFELWLAFVATSTVIVLIPGPTVLLVLSYALSRGRTVALATASGVAFGDFLAMSASLAGLGALVLASAELFTLLKWVGALYLIYLGVKLILTANQANLGLAATEASRPARKAFGDAATVTALNPKSLAFFIAFVPQFITPSDPLAPQFMILTATFVTLGGLNALAYAFLADKLREKLIRPGLQAWISRLGGGALIAMGVATLTMKRAQA